MRTCALHHCGKGDSAQDIQRCVANSFAEPSRCRSGYSLSAFFFFLRFPPSPQRVSAHRTRTFRFINKKKEGSTDKKKKTKTLAHRHIQPSSSNDNNALIVLCKRPLTDVSLLPPLLHCSTISPLNDRKKSKESS
jgi:hypothetical protein